jgi:ribosomal protein S24E
MNFEVLEERPNPLLGRREAKIVVHHEGQGTPDRITVRKLASEHYKTDLDRVYVKSISTGTGQSAALCVVEVYNDAKSAEVVAGYVKNRNLPKDQRASKGKKKEVRPAAAPAAQKPAAEKKAEPKLAEKKEEAKPAPTKEAKPPAAKDSKPAAKPESKSKA